MHTRLDRKHFLHPHSLTPFLCVREFTHAHMATGSKRQALRSHKRHKAQETGRRWQHEMLASLLTEAFSYLEAWPDVWHASRACKAFHQAATQPTVLNGTSLVLFGRGRGLDHALQHKFLCALRALSAGWRHGGARPPRIQQLTVHVPVVVYAHWTPKRLHRVLKRVTRDVTTLHVHARFSTYEKEVLRVVRGVRHLVLSTMAFECLVLDHSNCDPDDDGTMLYAVSTHWNATIQSVTVQAERNWVLPSFGAAHQDAKDDIKDRDSPMLYASRPMSVNQIEAFLRTVFHARLRTFTVQPSFKPNATCVLCS